MWGNRQGWMIAAVLVGVISLGLYMIARVSRMSAPTGPALDPANMTALALPVAPEDAWPIFTEATDAGAADRMAIGAWDDSAEEAARHFVEKPGDSPPQALQYLLDARHCRRMNLFSQNVSLLVNYDGEHAELEKLFAAGQMLNRIGLSLILQHRQDDGVPYLAAGFALGRNLYNERIVFDECQKGMELMADSAASMSQTLPRDSAAWMNLDKFQRGMEDYTTRRILPVWEVISAVDQATIDQTAGDVLALATQSKERMWRVEATLKLGRYRYDAGTVGDQVGAARALKGLANDPDAAVAEAARAAQNLTIEQYRMIH